MAEYFELTFFLDKEKAQKKQSEKHVLDVLKIIKGKNQDSNHQYPLFVGREVIFDVFEYNEIDFLEYRVCLAEFVFTKKNFAERINQLLQVVNTCFNQVDAILFATGIYELTYECIAGVKIIKGFNNSIFMKFPILFFRKEDKYDFQPTFTLGNVACVINKDAQDIFPNHIKEIMEDEGITFEEASKKGKL